MTQKSFDRFRQALVGRIDSTSQNVVFSADYGKTPAFSVSKRANYSPFLQKTIVV